MNRDLLETQWPQIREILKEKFSNLSEEDIRQINGRYDQLVAKLQQKYGYSREEAEERIRNFNFDRFTDTSTFNKEKVTPKEKVIPEEKPKKIVREDYTQDEGGGSSAVKWLIAIGIPILLLGSYFLGTSTNLDMAGTPPTNQEQTVTQTPADQAIVSGVRNALAQNPNFASQNIQVKANNGVVTLSGTVPSQDIKDQVGTTVRGFNGVNQVVNNLQVSGR